ncbi:peptidoglycan-binding domain-containing protein [Shouchella clausii]|uniref:peptidoglycan-binding domain-containing protein n=1 Tax=Shouchella clausii TaxID=79880 RepID=UPI000BA5A032|nr:peptidoglycan-binding protein [Shouchella clausii]PAD46224.1 hypothetical protein CHI09_13015 [Shouchella clausii]
MEIDNQVVNSEAKKRWIKMVQKQLIRENPSALPNYGVDGHYGPETTDWVQRFQERKGLQVDGVAGPETLRRLRADIVQRPDSSGNGVEILQEDLLFFYIQQSTVDGNYGPGTTQGVRDFQFLNNLVVDGIAGPNTLKKMDELLTTIMVQSGDTGSLVRRIQNQLNEQDKADISIEVDGSFGPATKSAVEAFQEATEQRVDGIAGPVTMNLLDFQAYQPIERGEFVQFLDNVGLDLGIEEVSDKNSFRSELEGHSAIQDVLPDGNIEDLQVMQYNMGGETFYLASFSIESSSSVYVHASFTSDRDLDVVAVVNIEGDLYENDATLTTYDVDGEVIEEFTQTILEFTNDSLDIQKEISQAISEYSEVIQIYVDFNDFVCSARKYIIIEAVCIGLPWALGVSIPAFGTLAGIGLVAACNIITGPFVDDLLEEDCG